MDWILSTLRLNWRNLVADKWAFGALCLCMAANNLIYFLMWQALFARISSLRGWGLSDVAFLYGSGAIGYGLLFTVFGGINTLSDSIRDGTLDVYLARPRSVLLSATLHRMRADSMGDVLSGIVMIGWYVRPEASQIPLILLLGLLSGIVYAAFRLICHSLAFWGTGNETSENLFMSFLIASTNPQNAFGLFGKCVLLTIFPAGYVALLPVEILHHFDARLLALEVCGSLAVLGFALWMFHRGLRHYASGNRFIVLR